MNEEQKKAIAQIVRKEVNKALEAPLIVLLIIALMILVLSVK